MASSVVEATSAMSSIQACARRCEDLQGCQVFAFASSGYTNCQVTREKYDYLTSRDFVNNAKWDVYTLRSSDNGGGGYYPPNSESNGLHQFYKSNIFIL